MKASSIIHKNEKRIKVEFPNSKESTQLIKEITGAKWSATMKSWHIPYTKEAFAELKQRCPDIEIIPAIKPAQQNLDPQNTNNDPEVDHANKHRNVSIIVSIPELQLRICFQIVFARRNYAKSCGNSPRDLCKSETARFFSTLSCTWILPFLSRAA